MSNCFTHIFCLSCGRNNFSKTLYIVEPPNNGQVGAGDFVCYSEVSFIGRLGYGTPNVFNETIMTSNTQI